MLPQSRSLCGSPLLKKTTTHLGQLRKSTGEFSRSAQGTPKLTIKKLRLARFARTAQFVTIELYYSWFYSGNFKHCDIHHNRGL